MDLDAQLQTVSHGAAHLIAAGELEARIASGRPLRVKLGIDPTASDVHLGFAVVLRKLREFQDCGHVAVLIIGDFTARVGDPSGRSSTRPQLSASEVDEHAASYVDQIKHVLDDDPQRLEIRRNSEWLDGMDFGDVLRLTSAMTVAQMLKRDDFAKRYAEGSAISITEFLYPLMQGWDSVAVKADVELGGTDQLFNLLVGRDLQQSQGQAAQVVLTTPLLVGLSGPDETGPKMSKSAGNYVGIAEPADEQFGKLMSIPDSLLPMYSRLVTAWPRSRTDAVIADLASGVLHPNAAKRAMAAAVCDLYHGAGAGASAEAEFDRVHRERERPTEIPEFVLDDPPDSTIRLSKLLQRCGLAPSAREGARLVAGGGVRLDGAVVVEDDEHRIAELAGVVLQISRRKWVRLVLA